MTQSIPAKRTARKQVMPPDTSTLLAVLNHFHPLSREMEDYLIKVITPCSFRKGKLILKAGTMCNYIYFIMKGAVRGFIREGHKDVTTWITVEGEMVTSIYGLDLHEPATENMQAVENCEMLALSFNDLNNLYKLFPDFNILTRKLLQQYYRDAEGRAFIARLTNAENKYKHFLLKSHHLANRIPLKYIASYLGMTLETLSRVRKKLSSRAK
ncbi:MAG TPA: Crp/Fnr family transcriptional regulator [Chitinophagaceae bacterium]